VQARASSRQGQAASPSGRLCPAAAWIRRHAPVGCQVGLPLAGDRLECKSLPRSRPAACGGLGRSAEVTLSHMGPAHEACAFANPCWPLPRRAGQAAEDSAHWSRCGQTASAVWPGKPVEADVVRQDFSAGVRRVGGSSPPWTPDERLGCADSGKDGQHQVLHRNEPCEPSKHKAYPLSAQCTRPNNVPLPDTFL
jgi:hypothetical protein